MSTLQTPPHHLGKGDRRQVRGTLPRAEKGYLFVERHAWTSPLLRWAGSKRKLVPALMLRAPEAYKRYIEPFAGSACLFFALKPNAAVLGDINSDLMTTYEMVRSQPRIVAGRVHALGNSKNTYYSVRDLFRDERDPLTRAVYFIYLNRYSFNGVYRTNRLGHFNVPYGTNTGAVPEASDFYRCSYALRGTTLLTSDFKETLDNAARGDFVYLDPPYSSCQRPRYGEYGYGTFQPLQLTELARAIDALDSRGAKFLLSFSASKASRKTFASYNVATVSVRRHVAGFAQHRRNVNELLVSNYSLDDNDA